MKPETSLANLYAYLKRFHLSESLRLIGEINAALKYGTYELWTDHLSPEVIHWLKLQYLDKTSYLKIFLESSRLARYLILSGANDYRDKALRLDDKSLTIALNLVGTLYDRSVEKEPKTAYERWAIFARMSQWQFPLQDGRDTLIGRGYYLFVVLPERLHPPYDFSAKMQEYYGLDAFEFMATGLTSWIKTDGLHNALLEMEDGHMKLVITDENQYRFLALSSGTHTDYRKMIRGEDWQRVHTRADIYGLDPFLTMPAVRIERSAKLGHEGYIVPQPKYLLDRASSGIFYLLAEKEKQIALAAGTHVRNDFRVAFGSVYRAYAGLQMGQGASTMWIDVDEDPAFAMVSGVRPDFLLIERDLCIVFEIKTSLLPIEARTYFDEATVAAAVNGPSFSKGLQQLNAFKTKLLRKEIPDSRLQNISRVITVILGYEDVFVLNLNVLPLIKQVYGMLADDLQLGCVSDLDAMGNALENGFELGTMLSEKLAQKETASWALLAFIEQRSGRGNALLHKAFDQFLEKIAGRAI